MMVIMVGFDVSDNVILDVEFYCFFMLIFLMLVIDLKGKCIGVVRYC